MDITLESSWCENKLVKAYIGVLVALVTVAVVGQLVIVWWPALSLVEQAAVGGVGTLIAITAVDRMTMRKLRFSPVVLFLKLADFMATSERRARTGREKFRSGAADSITRAVSRSSAGSVPVDDVHKRDPAGPAAPTLDLDVSMNVYGQTKTGKSTFVKAQIEHWDLSEPLIAHALSERDDRNEFVEFFEQRGVDILKISSRDSDVRWDPFLDNETSVTAMENIASGIFSSREVKVTGWSEAVRSMLVAAVIVTNAKHGDFARLRDVVEAGPDFIIDEVEEIPNADLVAAPLRYLDRSERGTVYTSLVNRIRPLLLSDLCDPSLDRLSLRDFFESSGSVIVLDNVTEDDYARGFWRFFIQSAIEVAKRTTGRQQFVLDELNELPAIDNLKNLTSDGRSAGVRGIIMAQDAYQMEARYGDLSNSIWANTPNSIMFRPGDSKTAELAIDGLGEVDLRKQSISSSGAGDGETVTTSVEPGKPLLTGDLMNLDIGEALINTPEGWWVCKITESEL